MRNNKEGDYTHITMDQIISTCKMRLRIESSDDDIFLERYANEGARHFDSLSTFIKTDCELEVVNGKAKLPNGFYQMLSVAGCGVGDYLYVDTPFLNNCGVSVPNNFVSSHGMFQIQDGYIYFGIQRSTSRDHGVQVLGGTNGQPCPPNATNVQNGPVEEIHHVRISYISMNVDSNGMMVVYSDMERGLVAYCVWMYMLDSPAGKYTAQQIQANEQMWINQKNWYKSIQVQNHFRNTKRQVASLTNAWVTKKDWYI